MTVAGRGRAGVAEASGRRGITGPKNSVALLGLSTRLLGRCSCEMDGFRVRMRDVACSRLL
jgi:hypothetical protein